MQPLLDPPPYQDSSVKLALPLPPDVYQQKTTAPEMQNNLHDAPKGAIRTALKQAYTKGDLDASEISDVQMFPVLYNQGAQGLQFQWEPIPLPIIREIKKAAKEYGITSHYTRGLLHGVAGAHQMVPTDWKDLMRMILSGTQYVVWESEYRRECETQAQNLGINLTADHLFGGGTLNNIAAQAAALTPQAFPHINACVLRALDRVDDTGTPIQSFSMIKEGATEPYSDFVERLQKAVERQISNKVAVHEIVMKLAVEHANLDCQRMLKPLTANPGVTLADFLKACRVIGTNTFNMEALAAAIQKGNQPQGTCFNCGKPGHFKKQCRAPGGGASKPAPNQGLKPKTVCPKCKKGFHWANQCRSGQNNQGN